MKKGNSASAQVELLVELLKATRSRPQTRLEVAEAMGVHIETASLWLAELVANGLLVPVDGELAPGQRGLPAGRFALSPEWGGKA